MTLQQLRAICEIVAHGFSVSRAAVGLHASQPAVSKMLSSLERELGAEIFVRSKGRLAGLTEIGGQVYMLAKRMLNDAGSLSTLAADSYRETTGRLHIAATHLHARYAVLPALTSFRQAYPGVDIELTQAIPGVVVHLVATGDTHLGVTTLPSTLPDNVITLPSHRIERCVITPLGHPLLDVSPLRLDDIVKYPMVTYDHAFVAGQAVKHVFAKRGLEPKIVLRATGADVLKAAVAAGLGIAVFQSMAVDPEADRRIGIMDAKHLFPGSQAHVVLRRGQYLRQFTFDFIARFAPQWPRSKVLARIGET